MRGRRSLNFVLTRPLSDLSIYPMSHYVRSHAMKFKWVVLLTSLCVFLGIGNANALATGTLASVASNAVLDLAGGWRVSLDPTGQGFSQANRFYPVQLPGTLRDSGLGDPVGPESKAIGQGRPEQWNQAKYAPYRTASQFKYPFWLQADRRYIGQAWYQRDVEIPAAWRSQRVTLLLERPHWRTEVWVDGKRVGENDSLGTPHSYDLTKSLAPGKHRLTVGVNNGVDRINVGLNSHSVSDHTQTSWHGIIGQIELRASPLVVIDDVGIFPRATADGVDLTVSYSNLSGQNRRETLECTIEQHGKRIGKTTRQIEIPTGGRAVDLSLTLSQTAKRWDEFDPNLCRLEMKLGEHTVVRSFGFRSITTEGRRILLNGEPLFLRGTLECCIFPATGYPPTDVESWKRIIRICKAHGLNHIRFHSWCPPEAAFVAADEIGFYYQVECSTWPNQGVRLGIGDPIDQWLYREGDRVVKEYANHPSFLLLAAGNEPAGAGRGAVYLAPWVKHFQRDGRHLVTSAAGWPAVGENDFHVMPEPRIQQWGEGLRSRINARAPETQSDYGAILDSYDVPVIGHEIGQWCVFPNFDEIKKYTGPIRPKNYEVFRDFLSQAGLLDQADDFLMASGKLQTLAYKEEIETSLRTHDYGGFQLLDLHDFPGQGTALVGVLDPFWDSKPYVTPQEYRRFCGPIVPLALMERRVWTTGETFAAEIKLSHFGPESLQGVQPRWSITEDGTAIASGALDQQNVAKSGLHLLGRIEWQPESIRSARQLNLQVTVETGSGQVENDWNFWVFPSATKAANSPQSQSDRVRVFKALDEEAVNHLNQGGTVWLMADPRSVVTDVKVGFSPIFWNTAWTSGQPPHTLGVLCDPTHGAFNRFPTRSHGDWQWWELIHGAAAMQLDSLSPGIRPVIQIVPDWFSPQRLALAFEARVGKGKLFVTSMDLESSLERRHAARQMRASLADYLHSQSFSPEPQVSLDRVRDMFRELPLISRLGTTAWADSSQRGHEAELVLDRNPATLWHTEWSPDQPDLPHRLTIDLQTSQALAGIRCQPRVKQTNGRIGRYQILVSLDGENWSEVAKGTWPNDSAEKTVRFEAGIEARYIQLVALSSVDDTPFASLADFDIIQAPISASK